MLSNTVLRTSRKTASELYHVRSAAPSAFHTQTAQFQPAGKDSVPRDSSAKSPGKTKVSDNLQDPPRRKSIFEELGASRRVRIVIIACLTVLGTIESVFWAQAAWRWFRPRAAKETGGDVAETKVASRSDAEE